MTVVTKVFDEGSLQTFNEPVSRGAGARFVELLLAPLSLGVERMPSP